MTVMENRQKAIEWWHKLSNKEKSLLSIKYSKYLLNRGFASLTGREIEAIWIKENSVEETEKNKKRFVIKGFHPESDSCWIEEKSFDELNNELIEFYNNLPQIDYGNGWYEIWDIVENKEVEISIKE